jgi:4-amino-4-deoxy-L-arabinose transferase-like glycosyltransferase
MKRSTTSTSVAPKRRRATRGVAPAQATPAHATRDTQRAYLLALAALLLLALAMRLALWRLPLHQLANDEVEYVTVARDLLAGHGWRFYDSYPWLRAPLYPLFLAGSLWLTGGDLHRAALPNIALSLINVGLWALLARELAPHNARHGRRLALVTAALGALLLTLSTFASLYMLETLFATLLSGALLALLRYRRRPRLVLAALAGVLLGLAALTRSLALPLLPLGALYLFVVAGCALRVARSRPSQGYVQSLIGLVAAPLVFGIAALLVIAPWSARNYQAYGQFILVETGFSYNMWAFNEPREDLATIGRALSAIPNPAERAAFANAQGMAQLRADPAILWRKLDDNWFALWRVKPIEDRFIQEDYYADVGLPYFASAFVLLIAAAYGLILAPDWRTRLLLGGWLVGTTFSIMLTHGESRYRHALFPALIPFAAWALVAFGDKVTRWHGDTATSSLAGGQRLSNTLSHLVTGTALAALLAWTFVASYPLGWAQQRVARGVYEMRGDLALARGDTVRAISAYEQAATAQPDSADALIALAQAHLAAGDTAAGEASYRAAWRLRPTYIPASAGLGDLLRREGDLDAAREAFQGRFAERQEIVDWSWRNLAPPPATSIDVGNGLDYGYVSGVYPAEIQQGQTARWTNGAGLLRLPGGQAARVLRLRLAAPHPDGQPVTTEVCVGNTCQPLLVGPTWRTYTLVMPPSGAAHRIVTVHSPTFASDQDGRRLGLLLDWARVAS